MVAFDAEAFADELFGDLSDLSDLSDFDYDADGNSDDEEDEGAVPMLASVVRRRERLDEVGAHDDEFVLDVLAAAMAADRPDVADLLALEPGGEPLDAAVDGEKEPRRARRDRIQPAAGKLLSLPSEERRRRPTDLREPFGGEGVSNRGATSSGWVRTNGIAAGGGGLSNASISSGEI